MIFNTKKHIQNIYKITNIIFKKLINYLQSPIALKKKLIIYEKKDKFQKIQYNLKKTLIY